MIENIIAGAILSGIVIILISFMVKMSIRSNPEMMINSMILAQNEMEEVLFSKVFKDTVYNVNKWSIKRKVSWEDEKVTISIKVQIAGNPAASIELHTIRVLRKREDLQ